MNKIYVSLFCLALTGCSLKVESTSEPKTPEATEVQQSEFGNTSGLFMAKGGGTVEVRKLEVDGTTCIWVGRYNSSAVSCNWK